MTLTISNQLIWDEAKKFWIWVELISSKHNLIELNYNWDKKIIRRSRVPDTSWVLSFIADNKESTYEVMDYYGFSCPKSLIADNFINAKQAIDTIWFPLVIKPEQWAHWEWVTTNISSETDLLLAFEMAKKFNNEVLIQRHFNWYDFRILVIWWKVRAVAKRIPARVYWDSESTIEKLISEENKNPLRWDWHTSALTKIDIDADLLKVLKASNLNLNNIPNKWEEVFLRKIWNLSQGWEAEDVTDSVTKKNIILFEAIAKALNSSIIWIDILAHDLSKDLCPEDYVLIEVNVSPWLRMHHFPSKWKSRNVALDILKVLYPNAFEENV